MKNRAAALPALDPEPRYFHCSSPSAKRQPARPGNPIRNSRRLPKRSTRNRLTKTAQVPTVLKMPYMTSAMPPDIPKLAKISTKKFVIPRIPVDWLANRRNITSIDLRRQEGFVNICKKPALVSLSKAT